MASPRAAGTVFTHLFGFAYIALAGNLALVVATAPFLLVVLSPEPLASWPLVLLTAPLLGPALSGVFTVFADHARDGSTTPWRTFARGWWRGLRTGLLVGAAVTALLGVLVVDVVAVWGRSVGAVSIPFFAVLAAAALLVAVVTLVRRADPWAASRVPLRTDLLLVAVLSLRRWYLGVVSLVVLGLLVTVVTVSPVLGLGLAVSPLLYVVWANSRFALQGVPASAACPAAAGPTPAGRAPRRVPART